MIITTNWELVMQTFVGSQESVDTLLFAPLSYVLVLCVAISLICWWDIWMSLLNAILVFSLLCCVQAKYFPPRAISSFSWVLQQLEGSQELGSDWFRAKGSWRCQRSGVEGNKKTRHDDNKPPSGGVGDTTRSQWNTASGQREKRVWLSFESSTSSVVRPEEGWTWELLFFVPVKQEPTQPSKTIMCHISCQIGWQSFRWMARSVEQG